MPSIGPHIAVKTGIIVDIVEGKFMGEEIYMCKIDGKIYKMTPEEFREKWKKCDGKRGSR